MTFYFALWMHSTTNFLLIPVYITEEATGTSLVRLTYTGKQHTWTHNPSR